MNVDFGFPEFHDKNHPMSRNEKRSIGHPKVALLVGAWSEYGRGIIEGVWQYAEQHGPWLIEIQPSEPDENTDVPQGWTGDGVIALIHTRRMASKLRSFNVPVVNVSGTRREGIDFPRVTSDADAVMGMAIAHLREKGLANIAFCGEPHRSFIDHWTDTYLRMAGASGVEPLVYMPSKRIGPTAGLESRQKDRCRWIESLPKPVGLIGWHTGICRHLAMACDESGINVPEEVAIISLESEDLLGKVVHPPLSGVDIPVRQIGYEAAAQLDRLFRGESVEQEIDLLPLGVTSRQSTDLVACEDVRIRQSLIFIRDHAHEGINVSDLLKAVPMARRSMEKRFQEVIGRSPAEEIRRVKINKVRSMLGDTDIPIPDIAEICGFNYVEHMIPIFKKHFGHTPSQYRKAVRPGA